MNVTRIALLAAVLSAAAFAGAAMPARSQAPNDATAGHAPEYPGVADLMNAIIQPRHAKLGLAGAEGNWPLAAFAAQELQQSFDKVGHLHPKWRGLPLPHLIEATVGEPLKALHQAIKAHDAKGFAAAYATLTIGCNSCHEVAQRSFVVIKAPDHSAFPNQDFHTPKH